MNVGHLLFSFEGRIRRTHYWLASLGLGFVMGIVMFIALIIFGGGAVAAFGSTSNPDPGAVVAFIMSVFMVLFLVFLVFLWPILALQVKRWHDRDKAWPWVFIGFIPLIGSFWVLIELGFLDGTQGPNRFGPSPKGITGPPPMAPVTAPAV